MKSTSAVALTIGVWMFSSCGWGATQAAEPNLGSSFEQWCQQQASLSAEARKTLEVLLEEAGTSDCELAAKNLSSRTALNLVSRGISDLSPLSELTNLAGLYLYNNQITDVSPLAGLTNLQWLDLNSNQIADVSPLAGLTNLIELHLNSNQITDVSPLARLTNLFVLNLQGNAIPSDNSANAQPTCPVSRPDVCRF